MKKKELLEQIRGVCLLDTKLTGKESLRDSELFDSMAIISLMAYFDKEHQITLNPDKIKSYKTLNNMIEGLCAK